MGRESLTRETMEARNNRGTLMTVFLLVAVACLLSPPSDQCEADLANLVKECERFVRRSNADPPSNACCTLVNRVHITCASPYVTEAVLQIISADRALKVARDCGRPLESGLRIGSYTVP